MANRKKRKDDNKCTYETSTSIDEKNKLSIQNSTKKIGVNPFVYVPNEILLEIFTQHGKGKRKIPIRGHINGMPCTQTSIKYCGDW